MNKFRMLLARLDSVSMRKLLWIILAIDFLVTLSHGMFWFFDKASTGRQSSELALPVYYATVPLACLLTIASGVALIKNGASRPVLGLHGVILSAASVGLLLWSGQIIVHGLPAGNFHWTLGILSGLVFFSVFLLSRFGLPQSIRAQPAVLFAPIAALLIAVPIDMGVLVQVLRDDVVIDDNASPPPADPSLIIRKVGNDAIYAEQDSQTPTKSTEILLSTSFEASADIPLAVVRPFHKAAKLDWRRDVRAHSGEAAINLIPFGNPGKLGYFNKPLSIATLSSRLGSVYEPFQIGQFRSLELEFWQLSTSNPSESHNCLGSLSVEFRFDAGPWESKMLYCGKFRIDRPEWRQAKLAFDVAGKKQMELRFQYEYPPDTRVDPTAVYLIDDLMVRGYQ